jgi:hypothetical protein
VTVENLLPTTISEARMATTNVRSIVLAVLTIILVVAGVYLIDPTLFGLCGRVENFESTMSSEANYLQTAGQNEAPGEEQEEEVVSNPSAAMPEMSGFMNKEKEKFRDSDASGSEGFADLEDVTGPAAFDGSASPAGCYPRDQLTPGELLPKDPNSVWAQQNPMGTGSLKGKNFLSAGALIGVNTVGQSLRNANHQLRSEPPNPQVPVTVFNVSTIEPDTNRRDLEVN